MTGRMFSVLMLTVLVYTTAKTEDIQGGFMHNDIYRTYLLHVPPSYNGDDSTPLIINLHWGGGTPQGQADFCGMNTKADSAGFIIVYPAGTIMSYGWLGWNSSECLDSDVEDVDFISQLIDTLVDNYCIDTFRIFATGFCNGAMMVHKLACELSDRIAAFAPVAAGLTKDNWNECQPSRPVSILHFHARNDPSVPYYGGWYYDCYWPAVDSFMNYWVGKMGCDIVPDTFYNDSGALRQRWSRADDSSELILWTTEDGSHYWPGSTLGTKKISANDLMWEFFLEHPLPVAEPAVEEKPAPPLVMLDPSNANIFDQRITIRFSLPSCEHISLELYDTSGRKIATPIEGVVEAGQHEAVIDARSLARGVYFCRISTPHGAQTQNILVVK